jgi:outer membrane protein assembly factor BamD (BamD/ComL family)
MLYHRSLSPLVALLAVFISCTENDQGKPDSTGKLPARQNIDCAQLYSQARTMDSTLLVQLEVDNSTGNQAIKAFTDFAYYCRNDSMSPVYLIKAAQVARAVNNIPQAKLALDHCIETYPAFKNRDAALFLLAQLYDDPTYLNNEAEAKRLYEKIIREYPGSDWALSSKGAIHFIGKSDAQILEEIKNKKQNGNHK